jgi:N-acylneuraminate cytidylyltransferase
VKVLGIIPARGGSKSVPRKNIRLLGGKPLLEWTLDAVRSSKRLTRAVVSTEDEEIATIARGLGADVPFLRPAELATDGALSIPVMQHALHVVEQMEQDTPYDAVVMLQPTAPFRLAADIDGAIDLFEATAADSVISVANVDGHHPARMKYLDEGRLIDPPFCEAYENQPRQELRPMYIKNGAIYVTRRSVLLAGSFKGTDCRAWVMPADRSANIDSLADFRYAECIAREGSKQR